jgi:hypothetical protein
MLGHVAHPDQDVPDLVSWARPKASMSNPAEDNQTE